MRKAIITIMLLNSLLVVKGQQAYRDSLKNALASAKDDSTKLACIHNLFYDYLYRYLDSAIIYVQQEILLAEKNESKFILGQAYFDYGAFFGTIGDFPRSLHYAQEGLKIAEEHNDWLSIARAYSDIGGIYFEEGDYDNALALCQRAKKMIEQNWKVHTEKDLYTGADFTRDTILNYNFIISGLADIYEKRNQLDSALHYVQYLNDQTIQLYGTMHWSIVPYYYGNIYRKKNDYVSALKYYNWGMALAGQHDVKLDIMKNGMGMTKTFKQMGVFDSAIFYANRVIQVSQVAYSPTIKLEALNILAAIYKSQNKIDSVAKYLELVIATKDSLFGQNKNIELQSLRFDEQVRQQKQVQEQDELQDKIKFTVLIVALLIFFLVGFLLYRNNRHKQKANALLTEQKEKVESTLQELKSTQAQLIHSEKMASLGKLTAGIAHEIQNPLNFVNNFSEVNDELIDEIHNENDINEIKAIANDIKQNNEKISFHGKRADAIVKGMLQHSKTSTGIKEPTDINKLADEYLRLSYHGMRAKDKSFEVKIKTEFDESIGKINVVSQDIGRVLLNLFNNAFYAVNEKKKTFDDGYEPTVSVVTKKLNDKIEIKVQDTGNGIPESIVDKIFQPFFTTKPTGQGTGLGLSLAYDIIKAHQGEIRVESQERKGSVFTVLLPELS